MGTPPGIEIPGYFRLSLPGRGAKSKVQIHLDNPPAGGKLIRMRMLSELAKDALELPALQRMTLARILLDLTEEDGDYSPQVEDAWDDEIGRRLQAVRAGTVSADGQNQPV